MQNLTQQPMFVPDGNPENTSEPEATWRSPGQIGAFHTVQNVPGGGEASGVQTRHDKTYRLVRTDSSMTVGPYPGAVAWWADRARYQVTTDPTALGRGNVAGRFCRAWNALGDLMFIQTDGPGTVKFVDAPTAAPTAAGLFVIPSATAAKADCLAAGTAATYPILGKSTEAVDGNAEATVNLSIGRGTP
jgi:hypothetical protein